MKRTVIILMFVITILVSGCTTVESEVSLVVIDQLRDRGCEGVIETDNFVCNSAEYIIEKGESREDFVSEDLRESYLRKINRGLQSIFSVSYDYKIYESQDDWLGYTVLVFVHEWENVEVGLNEFMDTNSGRFRSIEKDILYPHSITFYGNLTIRDVRMMDSLYENPPRERIFYKIGWVSGNKIISATMGPVRYGRMEGAIPYIGGEGLKPILDKYMERYPITS